MPLKLIKKGLFLLALIGLCFSFFSSVYAEDKSITITASVPDEIPPSAPILVAPENGAYLANPTPTFIFKKSYDAQSPIRHYQMYLNGSLFIPEIPSSQTPVETDQFYCIITQETISVTLKEPLADGLYTWKIRAYDMYGNWADSATWTFTIDTLAPFIIITQIGENTDLNLSSQDLSSIPSGLVIETISLQPEFKGRSEPGARIQISLEPISYPENETILLTGNANPQGRFTLTPKTKLKRGEKYKVVVIAADAAGNTTVLPEFFLLIKALPPVPIVPLPSLPPLVEIPKLLLQLPQPTAAAVPAWQKALPYLTLVFLTLWLITSKLAYGFSWLLLAQFLKLFLIPPFFRRKRCLVFNSQSKKGIAFATITIFSSQLELKKNVLKKIKEFLADQRGRFNLKLDKGKYQIKAWRQGFFTFTDNLVVKQFGYLSLSLALNPDPEKYKKYLLITKIAKACLWLALISSIISLVLSPNIITLIIFLFCLDLTINSLV